MNTELVKVIESVAESCLPKACALDKENPALFFSKHLHKIGEMVRERENLGNARYEIQFDRDVLDDWTRVLENTLVKMGYSVSCNVNPYGLAVFILRWQAIDPAV